MNSDLARTVIVPVLVLALGIGAVRLQATGHARLLDVAHQHPAAFDALVNRRGVGSQFATVDHHQRTFGRIEARRRIAAAETTKSRSRVSRPFASKDL